MAYSGDIIIVVWEIDAWSGNNFGLDGRDIIQRQLTYNGSVATNYHSRVNMDVMETQAVPSVAADYSYDVLYSFYDENDLNIRFKSSHCTNQYLRINRHNDVVGIYPNPAKDNVNINIEEDARISLYDINGRLVYEELLMSGNNSLDLRNFNSGIYFVKLEFQTKVQTKKLIIY